MEFHPDKTGPRHLIQTVEDAGFDAQVVDADRCALTLMSEHITAPDKLFVLGTKVQAGHGNKSVHILGPCIAVMFDPLRIKT